MADKKALMLDHDYDGIRELDNDLPPWWLYMFYISIVFAVVYMLHYHVFNTGDLSVAEYKKELDPNWRPVEEYHIGGGIFSAYKSPYYQVRGDVTPRVRERFNAYIGPEVHADALIVEAMRRSEPDKMEKLKEAFPDLFEQMKAIGGPLAVKPGGPTSAQQAADLPDIAVLTDAGSLNAGKAIYVTNCVPCHGKAGEGGIGPNMTDDYWIHGGEMKHIANTINVGVPAKGMTPWRGILKEDEINQVSSYILTLRGSNPPNAKKPQGEKVEYLQ